MIIRETSLKRLYDYIEPIISSKAIGNRCMMDNREKRLHEEMIIASDFIGDHETLTIVLNEITNETGRDIQSSVIFEVTEYDTISKKLTFIRIK